MTSYDNVPAGINPDVMGDDDAKMVADLVETLIDGVRGYRTAADKVEDPQLAAALRSIGSERRNVAERLLAAATDKGLEIEADFDGTTGGGLHRTWIALEGALAGDGAVVGSAIRGEEHALSECNEALGSGLPESIATVVRSATDDIRGALNILRSRDN